MDKLSYLRELISKLNLHNQIQNEISDILSEVDVRLYSLEEDRKRLLQHCRDLDNKIFSLEKSFSEFVYKHSNS